MTEQDVKATVRGWLTTLSLKDWFTIPVAWIALVVSVLNLYFTNCRVEEHLTAQVVDIRVKDPSDSIPRPVGPYDPLIEPVDLSKSFIVIRIVLANSGNRPGVVMRTSYSIHGAPSGDRIIPFDLGGEGEGLPVLVPAGDLRIVTVHVPVEPFSHSYSDGSPHPDQPELHALYGALILTSVDSRGKTHRAVSTPIVQVTVDRQYAVWSINPFVIGSQAMSLY